MIYYEAIIKECLNDHILKPSYHGKKMCVNDLINLWGLDEPDIEWCEVYEVDEETGIKTKIYFSR